METKFPYSGSHIQFKSDIKSGIIFYTKIILCLGGDKMFWYSINNDYIKYLKKYDKFVPNVEYKNKMKCFLGIILRLDGTDFFAPLTSYKKKFDNMKNDLDFFKIVNYKTGKIYGAIDLNNMIPVTSSNYTRVTFDNLEEFRIFDNQRDKKLYMF